MLCGGPFPGGDMHQRVDTVLRAAVLKFTALTKPFPSSTLDLAVAAAYVAEASNADPKLHVGGLCSKPPQATGPSTK